MTPMAGSIWTVRAARRVQHRHGNREVNAAIVEQLGKWRAVTATSLPANHLRS